MAGTRLAAHAYFLLFSLISVLVAWRIGVVNRAPLPINTMANLGEIPPAPLSVDVDLVLLHSPEDCLGCSALLDAMQGNPSLSRNAFRLAQQQDRRIADGIVDPSLTAESKSIGTRPFEIREVNLRVVHASHGLGTTQATPPASDPKALDDWLQQIIASDILRDSKSSHNTFSPPHYTFFIGCPGEGAARELPTFIMGKRRHGYLGLGCGCSLGDGIRNINDILDSGIESMATSNAAGKSQAGKNSDSIKWSAKTAAAVAVLDALAGLIVTHVLRSPVPPGDVHVRLGQAYRLNFSLLSENPSVRQCTWDFAAASRRYLRPMLRKLHPVASFAIQSQEVHYARLSSGPPRKLSSKQRWYYTPRDLRGFLGTNDFSTLDLDAAWGAGEHHGTSAENGTSVSSPHSQVAINFMIFCPSLQYNPLVFMEEWAGAEGAKKPAAEAYEVPGFGGVSVVNIDRTLSDGKVDLLESSRIRPALGAHVSQLRRIIGLPRPKDRPFNVSWPLSCGVGDQACPSCEATESERKYRLPLKFLPSRSDGVTDWEVDALVRAGFIRNRAAAAETLRSLAALVESRPEMEVSTKVAEDVRSSISALAMADTTVLDEADTPRGDGSDTPSSSIGSDETGRGGPGGAGVKAMHWARESLRRAESAYFDPTMVPQLYFPEDHLMAVYLPFLGPLALPLLWGFVQELLRYRRKRRAKENTGAGKREPYQDAMNQGKEGQR